MYLFMLSVFTLACSYSTSTSNGVEVNLETATTTIRSHDPLLLKVSLHNRGVDPLVRYSLSSGSGALIFEIRYPGTNEYVMVRAVDYQTLEIGRSVPIPPGGRACTYETLFHYKGEFVFNQPGEYELRAKTGPGKEWVSPTIKIHVQPIPADQKKVVAG